MDYGYQVKHLYSHNTQSYSTKCQKIIKDGIEEQGQY